MEKRDLYDINFNLTGETCLEGIINEIKEELWLTVLPNELKLIYSGREDSEQVFHNLYYLQKDFEIADLVLQKEEVDFVKWFSISEVELLIKDGLFFENHAKEFYRLLDIL